MSTRLKVLLGVLGLLTAFAFGRWAAPTKVITVKEIVQVEKKTKDQEINRDKHKETTTTTKTNPDGTTETTTKTVEDTKSTKDTKTTDNTITKEKDTKEVTRDGSKVTVSALAGIPLSGPYIPDYGVSITKPVLGPIAIGIFGFKSSMVGASLGLTF